MVAKSQPETPGDIAKQVDLVRRATDRIAIYAPEAMTSRNRSRLIGQAIPFVVPGNQLYIPELALDLREHFRSIKSAKSETLTPAAQALLFYHILASGGHDLTPKSLAQQLGYSAMTISRAFDDLVSHDLAHTQKVGRERHIDFDLTKRDLLDRARSILQSPVRAVKYVAEHRGGLELQLAGESALAEYTDLSGPKVRVTAIAARDWPKMARTYEIEEIDEASAAYSNLVVETWSYDPSVLSNERIVDPLSLYAQFHAHEDERVSMAAEQLLEQLPW